MQSHVIENMNAADLKAQRAELVEAVKAEPPPDLAERYVQARTDAAMRDEKLAEQGRTITTLNDSLADTRMVAVRTAERLAETERQLQASQESALNLAAEADAERAKLSKAIADLKAVHAEVVAERDAALKLATARRAALADVMTKVTPLLVSQE